MLLARCLGAALLLLLAPTAGCGAAVAAAASEPDGDLGAACPSPAGCDSPESERKATCDDAKPCGVREEGESCGVYTSSCAPGLRCVPRPGERTPLQALLRGKGVCVAPQAFLGAGGGKNQTEPEPVAAMESTREDLLLHAHGSNLRNEAPGNSFITNLKVQQRLSGKHSLEQASSNLASLRLVNLNSQKLTGLEEECWELKSTSLGLEDRLIPDYSEFNGYYLSCNHHQQRHWQAAEPHHVTTWMLQ